MSPSEKPRKILCIRPDNMGDLLMSAPAMRALKETFNCHLTLLTSSMAKGIASFIAEVDECIVWDVPWVKGTEALDPEQFFTLISDLRERRFDYAVIFTVFSQNPLPTAMLAMLAGIPNRLAYCRENPYQLLTHWVPEEEPYRFVRHQVRRDMDLVAEIGAHTSNETINIAVTECEYDVIDKITKAGVQSNQPWIVFHPGASEKKREYPAHAWIEAGKAIATTLGQQILVTGVEKEKQLANEISLGIGNAAHNLAGVFSLEEFISFLRLSRLVVSVNTGTAHLAAAVQTKLVVLYALTNPQHAPWKGVGKVLPYSIPSSMQSKNPVLRYVQEEIFNSGQCKVEVDDIVKACHELLKEHFSPAIPELIIPERV